MDAGKVNDMLVTSGFIRYNQTNEYERGPRYNEWKSRAKIFCEQNFDLVYSMMDEGADMKQIGAMTITHLLADQFPEIDANEDLAKTMVAFIMHIVDKVDPGFFNIARNKKARQHSGVSMYA